jgi:hypothetical protein
LLLGSAASKRNATQLINVSFSLSVIRVTSDADIVVFGANKLSFSIDAFLALPTSVLGRNHLVLSYRENQKRGRSTFLVSTGRYRTSIAIQLPKKNMDETYFIFDKKLHKGGSSLVLNLERYTAFQVSSTLDLTGTQIVSDQPVAVFAGNEREKVTIPGKSKGTTDYLIEQLPSVNRWGKDFITTAVKGISIGQKFRILGKKSFVPVCYSELMFPEMAALENHFQVTEVKL